MAASLDGLIEAFSGRYADSTYRDYRRVLTRLFAHSGRSWPSELTEGDLLAFCTAGSPANNTVYQRRVIVAGFLRWCEREGIIAGSPADRLSGRDSPLRSYRRTYGKVQAANPGRWLTHDQAYGALLGACRDGTVVGVRDELVIRLGLMGMRLAEISGLVVGDLRQLPTVTWTGKGHQPRKAAAGQAMCGLLRRWLDGYDARGPASPVICRQVLGAARQGGPGRIDWGKPASPKSLYYVVTARARAAGLGHVAPHDLRRSAAGILHGAVTGDGAHHFDLLDIQRVLGHSDPATTMRSYLEPMATDVLDLAATFLD